MVEPPGQQGLLERLAAMDRRIEELSRRPGGSTSRIDRVRLDDWATQIEFTDIPQNGYEHLQLVISAGITGTASQAIRCRFNGRTSGYDTQFTLGAGTGISAGRLGDVGALEVGVCGPETWNPSCTCEAIIANYAKPTRHFTTARASFIPSSGALRDWSAAGFFWGQPFIAINRLTLFPAADQWFAPDTTITVYGLA